MTGVQYYNSKDMETNTHTMKYYAVIKKVNPAFCNNMEHIMLSE